jgi:hypothetical protein
MEGEIIVDTAYAQNQQKVYTNPDASEVYAKQHISSTMNWGVLGCWGPNWRPVRKNLARLKRSADLDAATQQSSGKRGRVIWNRVETWPGAILRQATKKQLTCSAATPSAF